MEIPRGMRTQVSAKSTRLGAGRGNRTLMACLEGRNFTIKLYPRNGVKSLHASRKGSIGGFRAASHRLGSQLLAPIYQLPTPTYSVLPGSRYPSVGALPRNVPRRARSARPWRRASIPEGERPPEQESATRLPAGAGGVWFAQANPRRPAASPWSAGTS